MRYKIKIITYNDGDKRYDAYVRKFWFYWKDISPTERFITREDALAAIDINFGNEQKSIEFEYIEK